MGWKITLGDESVLLDDLPIVKIEKVAAKHSVSWYELIGSSPGRYPSAFYDVIRVVAEELGVDPPAQPVSVADAKALLEFIDFVADDLPVEWVDGNPPVGDPTIGSLSGEPDVSDGVLT